MRGTGYEVFFCLGGGGVSPSEFLNDGRTESLHVYKCRTLHSFAYERATKTDVKRQLAWQRGNKLWYFCHQSARQPLRNTVTWPSCTDTENDKQTDKRTNNKHKQKQNKNVINSANNWSNTYTRRLTPWRPLLSYRYNYPVPAICNFWHPSSLMLNPERQSVRMSKITNDNPA